MSRSKVRQVSHDDVMAMARGDTGINYLNEMFGVFDRAVDGFLCEVGLLNPGSRRDGQGKC